MSGPDMDTILEPLIEERTRLDRQESDLMLQVNKLRDEKKRIEKVLRAAGLIENNYAGSGKRSNGTVVLPPDEQQVERVRKSIVAHFPDEDFSVNSLDKATKGVGKEKIQGSIEQLRREGSVRMKGKARGGGRLYALTGVGSEG